MENYYINPAKRDLIIFDTDFHVERDTKPYSMSAWDWMKIEPALRDDLKKLKADD